MVIISECTFTDFELLKSKEVVIDNSSIGLANECTFEIPQFAYPSDTTDTYRNDFASSLLALSNRYSTPRFFLEIEDSCDNWSFVSELTDNTYGIYYSESDLQSNWRGFKVEWYKVYNDTINAGVGCYRVRQQYTDLTDSSTKINYSYKYNLKLFNENLADKTTKLTYTINGGKLGSTQSDEEVIDYGSVVWDKEIRLPNSILFGESSEFTRETTRYKNGGQTPIEDSQVETIQYNARQVPYSLHREIKITALQCGELYISDYNKGNVTTYNRKRVRASSEYAPIWATYATYAPVGLTFEPYFQNLRRKRC